MPVIETNRAKIIRQLEVEGWSLARGGVEHDIYKRDGLRGTVSVPRHRTLSIGVARQIGKIAGWL